MSFENITIEDLLKQAGHKSKKEEKSEQQANKTYTESGDKTENKETVSKVQKTSSEDDAYSGIFDQIDRQYLLDQIVENIQNLSEPFSVKVSNMKIAIEYLEKKLREMQLANEANIVDTTQFQPEHG